ncbi:hypothetical protein K450DRAFT_225379 [Umbelopsis ramanniana AG]|uniref:FAD synthase n=1 Tax=Umbelopsis ramanniana AG TaxID=1314678 RepID=A0AAD5HI39_UMBRA|nr:uncharacterized protein K450DRAFT_225379 [Umbelopsis ramanniana AG]KAI8582903.1 hypothetical protein K450DRAFT_225379 [Umbelopsis ramanniana AG]
MTYMTDNWKDSDCSVKPVVDRHLSTQNEYDFKYIHDTVYSLAQSEHNLAPQVREALNVIEEAVDKYGQGVLSLAFNGGKDCTVLLHLVIAALYHRLQTQNIKPIQSVYVTCRNPFPEVDDFVEECVKRYRLESIRVPAPMRLALQQFIDTVKVKPEAILVGIRRSDPYAENLTHFDPTDEGWPSFMRVHPIIDWSYQNVWEFLLLLGIPYCELYDRGYTSLGGMDNTFPNPELVNPDVPSGFNPAYMLTDEQHERCGRMNSTKK